MLWILATIVVVALMLITAKKIKASQLKLRQQTGLAIIVDLKSLINLAQQHRGLSSAFLNGDKSVENKLHSQEKHISILISNLNKTDIVNLNSRWESFLDHWQRLKQINHKTDALNNFKQHTQLIGNLLYLLEDEAENSQLTASSINELPSLGYVWRELILATENVGQSRAIGTGVATQGTCGQVDKIRLSFLEQHITQTSNNVLAKLVCTTNEKATHQKLIENALKKMTQLTSVINNELLQANKINISQSDYFDIASETMASLNAIFDHQVKQVKELI